MNPLEKYKHSNSYNLVELKTHLASYCVSKHLNHKALLMIGIMQRKLYIHKIEDKPQNNSYKGY